MRRASASFLLGGVAAYAPSDALAYTGVLVRESFLGHVLRACVVHAGDEQSERVQRPAGCPKEIREQKEG